MGTAEAERLLDEWDKETERMKGEIARENGFPTYDEYWEHLEREQELRHEEYERQMDEKCALLGKTREQIDLEDPQRWVSHAPLVMECECEGEHHIMSCLRLYLNNIIDRPFPLFCPKALVSYNSQNGSELMDYLARRRVVRIDDLEIEEGARSRRLDQDTLEKVWAMASQQDFRDIPFWAKADPVVRQLLDSRSPSPTPKLLISGNRPLTPTSPPFGDIDMDEQGTRTTISCNSPRSTYEHRNGQTPSSNSSAPSCQVPIQAEPKKLSATSQSVNPKTKSKTKHSSPEASSTTRIQKRSRKPASSTRSHNITYFYELGPSGSVIRRLKR